MLLTLLNKVALLAVLCVITAGSTHLVQQLSLCVSRLAELEAQLSKADALSDEAERQTLEEDVERIDNARLQPGERGCGSQDTQVWYGGMTNNPGPLPLVVGRSSFIALSRMPRRFYGFRD